MASTFASYFGQRSTIAYTTAGAAVPAGSIYTVSSNVGPTWSNTLTVSSFSTLTGSTITVSTLRYQSTIVSLGASTNQTYTTLSSGSYTNGWGSTLSGLTSTTKIAMNGNGSNILVARANSSTISTSVNAGLTWSSITGANGLPAGATAYPIATASGTPNYTSLSQSGTGQYVLAAASGGLLYQSMNYGTNFTPAGLGAPAIYLTFEGSVVDTVGTSAPVITGNVTYTTGKIGTQAVVLSNTPGGTATNYIRGTWSSPASYTVTGWFNLQSYAASANQFVFSTGGSSGAGAVLLFIAVTTNYITVQVPNNQVINTNVVAALNTWYNFTLVVQPSGSLCTLYLNNVVYTIASTATGGASGYYGLGTFDSGGIISAFNGYIDDVRIYNSVPMNAIPPLVYYPFQNSTADVMGGTPTVTGSPTFVTNSPVGGYSMYLNNTSPGGTAPSKYITQSLNLAANANFSFSGWFNIQSFPATGQACVAGFGQNSNANGNAGEGVQLVIHTTGPVRLEWYNSSNAWTTINGPTISTNTWYYFACIIQPTGTNTLYINGTAYTAAGSTLNVAITNMTIGGYAYAAYVGGSFNGYIDDLRVYSSVISYSPINPLNWTQTAISALGQYQLAAAATGGLFLSTNYGVTWTMVVNVGGWGGLAVSSTGQYMIACSTTTNYAPYYSTNYGVTWTTSTFEGNTASFVALSGNGQYSLTGYTTTARIVSNYLAGYATTTYTTPTLTGINANINCASMSATGQYMVIMTQGTSNNVYYSTNYGANWTALTVGSSAMTSCAISYDGTYITVSNATTVYTLNLNSAGYSIAVGSSAGALNQGVNAIALGNQAGATNQAANSIVLNATGSALSAYNNGLFVGPVATTASSNVASTSLLGYGADSQVTQTSVTALANGYVGIGTANPGSALHIWSQSIQNSGPVLTLSGSSAVQGSGPRIDIYAFYNAVTPQCRIESFDDGNYGGWIVLSTKGDGNASGALRETFRCGGPNNYVGIGTTNPSNLLHVNGAINCTSFLVNGVAVATGTGSVWGVNGSSAYYTSGNVGIGTTTPAAKFSVIPADGSNNYGLLSFINTSGYGVYANTTSVSSRGNTLDWYAYDYNFGGNNTRHLLTMRPEGLIGIGTTFPAWPLSITTSNFACTTGTNVSATVLVGGSFGPSGTSLGVAGGYIEAGTNYSQNTYIALGTAGGTYGGTKTERMRLVDTGFVGIGTTNPTTRLHVNGSTKLGTIGTAFVSVVAFSTSIGAGTTGVNTYTITFPTAYSDATKLIVNVTMVNQSGTVYADTLIATVQSISSASYTLNVVRADATSAWGQLARVHTIVYELV